MDPRVTIFLGAARTVFWGDGYRHHAPPTGIAGLDPATHRAADSVGDLTEIRGSPYSAALAWSLGSGSRMVTNSLAAVGWMLTVASKTCLVAPAFKATAMSCMISGASSPTLWMPHTRRLSSEKTSFIMVFSSQQERYGLTGPTHVMRDGLIMSTLSQ